MADSDPTDQSVDTDTLSVAFGNDDFWLDHSGGSGSLSRENAWVQSNSRRSPNDGRSHTRTTFYPEDAETQGPGQKHRDPDERRSWGDLAKWNDGMYSDKSRGSQNFWADNQRWIEIITERVGATGIHRERTQHILEAIDFDPYRAAHVQMEVLILAICSVLVDSEIEIKPDESAEEAMNRRTIERDGTKQILDAIDSDRQDVVEARRLLLERDGEHFE